MTKICCQCGVSVLNLLKNKCRTCYRKAYRQENKEAIAEYKKQWDAKNADHVDQYTKEYREKNCDLVKIWKSNWNKSEKGKLYSKLKSKEFRLNGGGKDHVKKYAEKNPEVCRKKHMKRRAAKLNAIPKWFSELDDFVMIEAARLCRLREKLSGVKWHTDHIIPIQGKEVSGFHVWNNVQVITAKQNQSKSNFFNGGSL